MLLRLFRLTKGVRTPLWIKALIGIMITGTYVLQAFLAAKVLNCVFALQPLNSFIQLILAIFMLMVARALLMWIQEVQGKIAAGKVKEKLRMQLMQHFFELGPEYMENERTGKVQSVLIDGIEALEVFLVDYIPQVMVTVIGLILILCYVFTLDVAASLIILVGVAIAITSPFFWEKVMSKTGKNHWQAYAVLNAQFLDAMQGMTTLKAFNVSEDKGKELEKNSKELFQQTLEKLSVSLTSTAVVGLATSAGTAFSIGLGAWKVAGGDLEKSSLFVLLFLTVECFRPLNELNKYWHKSFLGISAAEKMFTLLDAEPTVKNLSNKQPGSIDGKQPPSVEFNRVSFAYDKDSSAALDSVSFKINSGSIVALAGKSGAGKSTVVNLLLRFFDPQQGEILIDGKNIKSLNSSELRQQISVVLQDTFLFYGTIAENIRLGNPEAADEKVMACAKAANAHDFIMSLPNGYDTMVGERGTRLSGGERQRIAIARAMLKDAPVLVMDEATSNVDVANEKAICEGMERLMSNRTTLLIAHRLSTIQNAGKVFVLEDGNLVEEGTPQELVKKDGAYARLVRAQQVSEGRTCL